MRCPRCGNENADTNRFCGMCGASLISGPAGAPSSKDLRTSSAAAQPSRIASNPQSAAPASQSSSVVASPAPAPRKPSPPQPAKSEPGITGPSFLGLNNPPGYAEPRSESPMQNAADELQSSHSVDYLLEDDEEEPKRGWGKVLLVLVALGLALGFGYLHWKQGGFDWVTRSIQKAQATSPDTSASTPATASPTPGQPSTAAGGNSSQPATSSAPAPAGTPSAAAANAPPSSAEPTAGALTSPSQTAPSSASENPPPNTPTGDAAATSQPTKPAPAEKSEAKAADSETQPGTEGAPKPRPNKPSAAVPVSIVAEAERYIYGRGVGQDCGHGLRLLKRAAEYDPKAMTAMGRLYSTGTCTPRDLPTAYRWLAMALHKDPDNQSLQNDLQKLWSQMTQPERQLAIRLSQ